MKDNVKKIESLIKDNKDLKERNGVLEEENKKPGKMLGAVNVDIRDLIESVLNKKFSKEFQDREITIKNPVKEIIIKSILDQISVKNFPESFKISNLNDIKQARPQEFPKSFIVKSKRFVQIRKQIEALAKTNTDLIGKLIKQGEGERSVKILNSEPEDAIPVVLTTSDKKRFYNVMMQVLGAAGTDPKKLDNIISNTRIPSVIGNGSLTVAATSVPANLPNVPCKKVIIQANENNTARVVVGGSNAVRAALGSRNAIYLYKTWRQEFNVRNLNLLWIDAVVSGEGITYTYEN